MRREHLLTAVLADDTRFAIYRFVAERPWESVTVAEVAEQFGLHPNVARMHLGKLEQTGLVETRLRKGRGGGRPAKLYSLAEQVSTFAFPPRHYELLAALALEILAESEDDDAVRRVSLRAGKGIAAAYRRERSIPPGLGGHALAAAIQDIAEEQGLLPDVQWRPQGLCVDIRNCVFREVATLHPELSCVIHRSFFRGMIDELTGDGGDSVLVAEGPSMGCGGDGCRFLYTTAIGVGSSGGTRV